MPDYENTPNNEVPEYDNPNQEVVADPIQPESNPDTDIDSIKNSKAYAEHLDDQRKDSINVDKHRKDSEEKNLAYEKTLAKKSNEKYATNIAAEEGALAYVKQATETIKQIEDSGDIDHDTSNKLIAKLNNHEIIGKVKVAIISILLTAGITSAGFVGLDAINDKKEDIPADETKFSDEATTNAEVEYGDTAWNIVRDANPGASEQEIYDILNRVNGLNPGIDTDNLKPGDTFAMPSPSTEASTEAIIS
jgi:hypothetical protein